MIRARSSHPAARLAPMLLLTVLIALALAAPAFGQQLHVSRTVDWTSYDMAWSETGITLYTAPAAAPGQRMPSIDGDLVACRVGSSSGSTGFDIGFRFLGGVRGTWGGSGDQTQPAVSQGLIAGLDNGVVSVYDPAKGVAVAVSDAGAIPSAPAFAGDVVVWQDRRNGDWDIYGRRFDRATGQPTGEVFPVCTAPGDQEAPAVDGDIVVWQDRRNGDWDVFGLDLATGTEMQIAVAAGDQCRPDVCGQTVVWQDSRNGNWDIYAYDMESGRTTPISRAHGAQVCPAVSSELIVWQDSRVRCVQENDDPTVRYRDPDIWGYSLRAKQGLDSLSLGDSDGTRQSRPDVSGSAVVFEDAQGVAVPGALRVAGARVFNLWAYATTVTPSAYWTNASALTFTFDVLACPDPPVAEMSVTAAPADEWFSDAVWQPFSATATLLLDMPDGEKAWDVMLKDSAGHCPGGGGDDFWLDTHGPSCWASSAITVESGRTAVLPYKVTDKLSPEAKVTVTLRRHDGSLVRALKPRRVRTGVRLERSFVADLIRGTYTLEVTATDLAGNAQVKTGTCTLTVR